jgi:peptidoglycan/LPS O-acetylase OafA/YrhL
MNQSPLLQKHMPQLDVLRGTAIALVLIYHGIYWSQNYQPNRLENALTQLSQFGWLGVNLFFILSGFLITGILVDSKENNDYFSGFYIRRVLRIVPAYLLTIFLLLILHMLSFGGFLRAVTFTANYPLIPAAKTYGPLWSLSVEEQFYLIWPFVVFLCSKRTLTYLAILICLSEPLLRALAEHLGHHEELVHSATFLIADNLALGALAALFARSRHATRLIALKAGLILVLTASVILALGISHGLLHRATVLGAAIQTEPFDLAFTALVLMMLAMPAHFFLGPTFAPLRWLGNISYGLYLIHLIVFAEYSRFFDPANGYKGRFSMLLIRAFVCSSVSMALAWVSRRFYEEPFLRLKSRLAPRSAVPPAKPQTKQIA